MSRRGLNALAMCCGFFFLRAEANFGGFLRRNALLKAAFSAILRCWVVSIRSLSRDKD
jgi:hypothetical protein